MDASRGKRNSTFDPFRKESSRRALVQTGAATLAGASLLNASNTGLASSAQDSSTSDEEVEISYGYWGAARSEMVEAQIAAFREQHPNITVSPEVAPFDGY